MSEEHIQTAWLDDVSYQFWLNFGVTKTAYPGYNGLWCINEITQVIAVVAPRELIMATLNIGAEFYSNLPGVEIGLAFVQHVDNGKDSSFLIPIAHSSSEKTAHMDALTRAVLKSPDEVDALVKYINKSEPLREFWNTFVNQKKLSLYSYSGLVIPKQPLTRATNWRRIDPSEADYKGAAPAFWYTYPGTELKLDFCFKYRMELRTLLHRPSVGGLVASPIMIIIVLACLIHRGINALGDRYLKRGTIDRNSLE